MHKLNIDKAKSSYDYLDTQFKAIKTLFNDKIETKSCVDPENIGRSSVNALNYYDIKNSSSIITNDKSNFAAFKKHDFKELKVENQIDKAPIERKKEINPFLSQCNINNIKVFIENENKNKNVNINLNVNIYSREAENLQSHIKSNQKIQSKNTHNQDQCLTNSVTDKTNLKNSCDIFKNKIITNTNLENPSSQDKKKYNNKANDELSSCRLINKQKENGEER